MIVGVLETDLYFCRTTFFGEAISHESLIGRWRQTVQMFGHIFCDDVGSEPGSIINELGGFPVKETKFRREMEKLRNCQQRDLTFEVRSSYCSVNTQQT